MIVSLAGFNLAMAVRPFNNIGCKFSLKYSIASVELGYGSRITTIKYDVENKNNGRKIGEANEKSLVIFE